jgi:hypothetical protein
MDYAELEGGNSLEPPDRIFLPQLRILLRDVDAEWLAFDGLSAARLLEPSDSRPTAT